MSTCIPIQRHPNRSQTRRRALASPTIVARAPITRARTPLQPAAQIRSLTVQLRTVRLQVRRPPADSSLSFDKRVFGNVCESVDCSVRGARQMDKDIIKGKARQVEGRAQNVTGAVTND